MNPRALRSLVLALVSALFFTSTYVLNRAMAADGEHWAWSVSLRFLLTAPMLGVLVLATGNPRELWKQLRDHARVWLVWSAVGFGLFGVCLTWAAATGPAWLLAGSFQTTVLAGPLLAPLLYRDARRHVAPGILVSGAVVVLGVFLMQWQHADTSLDRRAGWALLAVVVAAFAYPLGNRKLLLHLEATQSPLGAKARVLGMALASLPVWLLVAAYGWNTAGPPSLLQVELAAGVALSSGVVATVLFFYATQLVRDDAPAMAAAEAMQATEVLFAALLGLLFLDEAAPHGVGLLGAVLVVLGVVASSLLGVRRRSVATLPPAEAAACEG